MCVCVFCDLQGIGATEKTGERMEEDEAAVENVSLLEKLAAMRAELAELGPRPSGVQVDEARNALLRIDACLQEQLENLVSAATVDADVALAPVAGNGGGGQDEQQLRTTQQGGKEKELREAAENAKLPYLSLIELDDLHQLYEDDVKQSELALEGISDLSSAATVEPTDEVDLDVSAKLQEAQEQQLDSLDLKGRYLVHLPESFGKISSIVHLNLANNCLEIIPDSIAGLVSLETLDVQHNQLKALPDSIGLLSNLKSLNISGNVLKTLPASLGRCSNLVELIANFNQLEVWPSDFGFQLVNLQKLYLHLNKITGLPSSIGELRSLKVLDIHFNKLRSLPAAIGNLLNLEMLDVSSNFNDLTTVPDSIGDLVSLLDLDLSFNQIHELPISIGRLTNLRRLKLEENPLTIPPMEIVQQGEQAVIAYMSECWKESLRTDEEKTLADSGDTAHTENSEGWLPTWAGGVLLNNWFGKMWTGGVTDMLGAKTWGPKKSEDDAFLDQQL